MKRILQIISFTGLALSVVPALMVFYGKIPFSTYYSLLNLGMVLWFGAAIFWIKPNQN